MNNFNQREHITLLSFDIEEYFQVQNLRSAFPKEVWDDIPSSVEKNTDKILSILDEYNVKGTFFILGVVALKQRKLIKKIADQGHEIASHGFSHHMTSELSREDLMDDLKVSKQILEDIIGKPVLGYRAPNFSVNDTLIELLKEAGYLYDSSLNLFSLHSRYGQTNIHSDLLSYNLRKYENDIIEIPIPAWQIGNFPVPMSGGAYFRIFPFPLFKFILEQFFKQQDMFNFYLHPWELEPEQPRVKDLKLSYKFRHYYGLKKTGLKLKKMIEYLQAKPTEFLTMSELVHRTTNTMPVNEPQS